MAEVAELLRAPRRTSPSEAAARYLCNERGAWSLELTPMWAEPLDMLASRDYRGIIVVGPARTGKTYSLVHGAIAYSATCAPGDVLVMQTSQDQARDFSRTEVDRVIRSIDLNVFDKYWRSGNALKIGWPTVTQLSGRTFQLVMLPDYDRPQNRDNVDGEGPLWDLALKRTETFMSRGKCLAESSPGDDYTVSDWRAATSHEAPPARGILSLYNTGTRARWYWPCRHCGECFQAAPGLEPFGLPPFDDVLKLVVDGDLHELTARYAHVVCPKCGGLHEQEDRIALNRGGRWIHEGESIIGGIVIGLRRRSPIASYWLGGCAAVFQRWDSMLYRYLSAVQTFAKLGDESQLRAVTNTDLGAPYMPRSLAKRRTGAQLRERAESWPQGTVPAGVRFLTAAVDVQSHRFVVQTHGWGVGLESWLIDRFQISSSKRPEGERFAALDPAGYAEDWETLREAIIGKSYPLADRPDQRLPIMLTLCDSGGREGVTARAYDFWRALRRDGHGRKLVLLKGTGAPNAPRVQRTFPDSSGRRDRPQGGRGDVQVFLINVNVLKDAVANDLARDVPGAGFMHLPDWLADDIFDELTAEVRTLKGWQRLGGIRNEAFDLSVYNRAAVILLQAERINWDKPPSWAAAPADTAAPEQKPAEPDSAVRRRSPFDSFPKRNWVTNW
jgi:phage terminase large subunit GpA-like protein